MNSKEIVMRAVEQTDPPRVPIFMFNRDKEKSDILMVRYGTKKTFVPLQKDRRNGDMSCIPSTKRWDRSKMLHWKIGTTLYFTNRLLPIWVSVMSLFEKYAKIIRINILSEIWDFRALPSIPFCVVSAIRWKISIWKKRKWMVVFIGNSSLLLKLVD